MQGIVKYFLGIVNFFKETKYLWLGRKLCLGKPCLEVITFRLLSVGKDWATTAAATFTFT